MSTRTGFPRMDWDTGFLADPKFQHLRDLEPDPIRFGYAGFCYVRVVSDTWRTCQRRPIGDVVRGIETWAADALRVAGLLDDEYRVTQESYDKWVGAAIEVRTVWRDKKKPKNSTGVSDIPRDSQGNSGTPDALRVGTVGTVGQVDTDEGVQGEAAVFAFLAQHGAAIRPDAPLGRRLYGLMDRRGADAVLREAQDMTKVENVMSDRQWVLGLENGLEAIPSGRKSVDEALVEEAQARNDARYARMVERRLEWFQNTGRWDEAWGPMPEPVAQP
jgi:hypothetical protein